MSFGRVGSAVWCDCPSGSPAPHRAPPWRCGSWGPCRPLPPRATGSSPWRTCPTATLDEATVTALVADLVLTLGHTRDAAAHAYALARVARTSTLLAGRGALVDRGVRPRRSVSLASEAVLDAREAARRAR